MGSQWWDPEDERGMPWQIPEWVTGPLILSSVAFVLAVVALILSIMALR